MQRLVSLSPNLVDLKGHQYAYHVAVQKKLPLPFTLYLSKYHRLGEVLPRGWIPFFSKKNNLRFTPFATMKRTWDFGKIFRKKERASRLFFLESFNTTDLLSLFFAALFFLKKQDSLLLLFRYDLRTIQTFLARCLNARCATDSELIAKQFANKKIDGFLLPIPHTEVDVIEHDRSEKMVCWWPGAPRPSKGKREILSLLKREKRGDFKMVFSKELEVEEVWIPYEQISPILSREDYLGWLNRSHLVLLPYDPVIYRSSTSGIFVETIIAGKMPLVKEGSWLSYELKKFDLSELIIDWKRADFFSYAAKLLLNKSVRRRLEKMQKCYLDFHSPESFVNILTNY